MNFLYAWKHLLETPIVWIQLVEHLWSTPRSILLVAKASELSSGLDRIAFRRSVVELSFETQRDTTLMPYTKENTSMAAKHVIISTFFESVGPPAKLHG